ncbi:gamma carbonic anhydrase family protein [Corynebacterium sp. SCR221107]|uniref:gamma carbonic anhydrase family protein n=1 Tax=Corynebacterium sp. SCR221107 TaxID=3017361 RepID=UPI0022EC7879|nr:gamma carbonic anhydrase family protein [Corynebacterium sp. SCR221107]WBT08892.1 gamma carbonic anhydrase family protein [Corynebacterium sp. SCR221107]
MTDAHAAAGHAFPHGPLILPCNGKTPRIHETAFIAPNATIIGDVEIGPHSSVFYGCVLRADIGPIRIGARTNIQDNSVLHVDADAPCTLGDDVTVGHMALVHGSTVGNGTLVGMKATLLSHSTVGEGSLIAAGAVVLEGQEIPAKSLAAGIPAKVRRELSDEQSGSFIPHAARYVETAAAQAGIGEALSLDAVRFSS